MPSAVNACPVPFFDDPFLSGRRVSSAARCIDWLAVGVVDQCPEERVGGELGDDRVGDWCPVVAGVPVAPNVENDFGVDCGGSVIEEGLERVSVLLAQRGPGPVGLLVWSCSPHDRTQEGYESCGQVRRNPDGEGDHPVGIGSPSQRAVPVVIVVDLGGGMGLVLPSGERTPEG